MRETIRPRTNVESVEKQKSAGLELSDALQFMADPAPAGCLYQPLSDFTRAARRETFREAVFLWTMPFWAARMISG